MEPLFKTIKGNKPKVTYIASRAFQMAIAVEAYCLSQQHYMNGCYVVGELIDDETPKWQEHLAAAEIHMNNIDIVARGLRQGGFAPHHRIKSELKLLLPIT